MAAPPKCMEHAFRLRLRDAAAVRLRPIVAADHERLRDAFSRLSSLSRHMRFFCGVSELTEEWLRYFTDVDQLSHVAWCAVNPTDPDEQFIGVGRFIRDQADPTVAEWAITVADQHQKRGLGSALLACLYVMANRRGVLSLRAEVLIENEVVAHWLSSIGLNVCPTASVYEVDMRVSEDLSHFAEAPRGPEFMRLIEHIRRNVGGRE